MYEQIIVVGSGKFAFQCALRAKEVHPKVSVFEYKASGLSVLERLCSRNDIAYHLYDKVQMTQELINQSDKKTLIISAFNTYLFPSHVVNKEKFTIVNYHNAYLPYHRGRNTEAWAIYEGADFSGVTWHFVDTGVDTGNIIIQEKIYISDSMTALELMQEQNKLGYALFEKIADDLLCGNITLGHKADGNEGKLYYSWEKPNNGMLNISWDIKRISCFLRAMDYGILMILGYAKITFEGVCYNIKEYRILDVLEPDGEIKCGDQLFIVKENKKVILKVEECLDQWGVKS